MQSDISLLITNVCGVDGFSIPYALITLDKLKAFLTDNFEDLTEKDELYMYVLKPNCLIPSVADFSISFSYDMEEGVFSIDGGPYIFIENSESFTYLIDTIMCHYSSHTL